MPTHPPTPTRCLALCAALWLTAPAAHAFCGFYVGSADAKLVNNATNVVLMREGDLTVLSMQNDYEGPPRKFALVVPVPVVLKQADVKTLPRDVFARVDRLAAPRLVEYWEQDPCAAPAIGLGGLGMRGTGRGGGGFGSGTGISARPQVRIEAQFAVGEYEIVILSADDSAALDTWLRDNHYNIPPGAEGALRPYVAAGMKFFVAKVNPAKVTFEAGRALLSPLRVAYQSADFRLPVRLGLLNSSGTQDLVVHILARDRRYEVANYPNVTIPTNLEVTNAVRERFPAFYAALFDETVAKHPGAVVTEYAWQATSCDPCPGPVLAARDLATLGTDVAVPEATVGVATAVDLRPLKPDVRGALDARIVQRVLRQRQNALRYCIERDLARRPRALSGPIQIDFLIGPDGAVPGPVKVQGADLDGGPAKCLQAAVKRLRFPKPTGSMVQVQARWRMSPGQRGRLGGSDPLNRFVLTRLHYRYGRDGLGEDLVFTAAKPIVGGREQWRPAPKPPEPVAPPPDPPKPPEKPAQGAAPDKAALGALIGTGGGGLGRASAWGGLSSYGSTVGQVLETGATESSANNFQGRYIIRHVWTGKVACDHPVYGVWGGMPGQGGASGRKASAASAAGLPPAKRGDVTLAKVVPAGIPELAIPPSAPPKP